MEKPERYLLRQVLSHASLFYKPEALAALERTRILFTSSTDAGATRGPAIAIPTDVPFDAPPRSPYKVPFSGTELTLWHPLAPPSGEGWHPIPDSGSPLWYRHPSGTHVPAWNLFGNLMGLLTFQEERQERVRDRHGRFPATLSPRTSANLLEVPAFNEAVAALVGACIGIGRNLHACRQVDDVLKPPVAVLSHDCDILLGDDRWTQGIRLARLFLAPLRGRRPPLANLWWVPRNAVRPADFYFDNIAGMVTLERMFGYTSTFYLLNGSGGRFGARSGSALLPEVIAAVPPGWDTGMHYNYDTLLDEKRFSAQRDELAVLRGGAPVAGRAHYIRFDPEQSLAFLAAQGLRVDESAGYSERIGYRCGVGGCFQAYDPVAEQPLSIWEIPMVVMDDTVLSQYKEDAILAFRRLARHLSLIGGALSVVVHPGGFYNPELPQMQGLYHKMLITCRDLGYRSETATALLERVPDRLRVGRSH